MPCKIGSILGAWQTAFTDEERAFIENRGTSFMPAVDPEGHPTMSYKGDTPGFVQVEGDALVPS